MPDDAGVSARWSSGPGFTVSVTALVMPMSSPVTACGPALVAVHTAPRQLPSGVMVNVVDAVTSPIGLPAESNDCAV
jgi:hypothetical protein